MKKLFLVALILCLPVMTLAADEPAKESKATDRIQAAADVLNEIESAPDAGIPEEVLGSSECVAVVPSMLKGGFIVGAKYGRGLASCRTPKGWSAPAFFTVTGGSFGFQIGGSETDVVMAVMNRRGAEKLLQSKFTLGADASVAAGPVGRTTSADTDAQMQAEILTWSRARGVFAGIALNGATLRPDDDTNRELYGTVTSNREVIDHARPPAGSRELLDVLNRYSSHRG